MIAVEGSDMRQLKLAKLLLHWTNEDWFFMPL
jgi:hypothetical protein